MAYDPYKDIKGIYDLKGMWEEANKAKNTVAKNKIASDAAAYYQTLKDNGYADIAEDLRTSNYNQAKATLNKYATMNKSPAREYLYTLGASRGMTQADVDKLISWDDSSKQMRFGGKTIGSPDAIVDGVSYFTDTGVLDNAFNDYISRSGTVRKADTAIKQENENLFSKYNEAYKNITETNPFDTAEAKAILDKYDLSAMNARNGEVASGSSSNGGNIDSFAAANALRQQKALIAQGQQTVLDARQRKIDNIRAILSDMGVNIDRVFNQEETAKNNQTQRDVATAEVTGKVPSSMLYQLPEYSQIFNSDGSLKNPDIDYMAEIQKAEANGNTNLAKVLKAARGAKIWSDYAKYGKFDDGNYTIPEGPKTETARRTDMEAEQQSNALKAQQQIEKDKNSTDLQIADKNNNAKLEAARIEAENSSANQLTYSQALAALKNGEINDDILRAYNSQLGTNYTMSNLPPVLIPMNDDQVSAWAMKLNNEMVEKYGEGHEVININADGTYSSKSEGADFITIKILGSDELTDAQKSYLLYTKFGIKPEHVANMLNDPHYN